MILIVDFETFFRLVNSKIEGRLDYEYGQIYYLEKLIESEESLIFYYGDSVWKYKMIISFNDFVLFYGEFDDFLKKYKPIKLLNIEKDIRLKVIE